MKTLREYIDLLESIDQPVKSGAEIAASIAPLLKNFDASVEQELDEINWRKGLAGAAAAGALALGAGGAQAAPDPLQCISAFNIASKISAQSGDAEGTKLFKNAAMDTAIAYSRQTGTPTTEVLRSANDYNQGMIASAQVGSFGPILQQCSMAVQSSRQLNNNKPQVTQIPKQGQQSQQFNNIPQGERAEDYARKLGVR